MTKFDSRNSSSYPHDLIAAVLEFALGAKESRQILSVFTEKVGEYFGVNRCLAIFGHPGQGNNFLPVEWCSFDPDPSKDKDSVSLALKLFASVRKKREPIVVSNVKRASLCQEMLEELASLDIKSFMAVEISVNNKPLGCLILSHCDQNYDFTALDVDVVRRLCNIIGIALLRTVQEQSVAKNVERFKLALNSVIDGILQYDSAGRLIYYNRKIPNSFGGEIRNFRGRSFLEVISYFVAKNDQREVVSKYANAIQTQKSVGPFDYTLGSNDTVKIQEMIIPLFENSGRFIGIQNSITAVRVENTEGQGLVEQNPYPELVEQAAAVIIKTDNDFNIRFINSRCSEFFGVSREEILSRDKCAWYEFVLEVDREGVIQKAKNATTSKLSFEVEFRIQPKGQNELRWLLAKFVPVGREKGEVSGWDGYAIDITQRKKDQDVLSLQIKKVKALYTVSSAIRGYIDPANIAYRGLASLSDATSADAGVCFLYSNDSRKKLTLVAHIGFSPKYTENISGDQGLEQIVNYVARYGKSVIVPDIKADPRVSKFYVEEEGLQSAVLAPVSVDDETLGTIALFSKKGSAFHGADVMLISAAANQIGLAARQAQLFTAYKRQTKNLAALYRISHELSSNLSLDEIFQKSFTVIREELGIKRFWLGLLNDVGTRIIGQVAYGPGWKRQLVQMNIDVSDVEHPFGRVINERKPIVLSNTEELFERFGLKRAFSRLAIDSVILVPLIGGGQVLGLIAIQPRNEERLQDEDEITLLSNLANEIGAVVLTKQLEQRINEADRMRTAGILAAGIAHNFNNLLQAILGQASLLEMQAQNDQKVDRAAKIIHQAAVKGAGLVKQLVSFAQLEEPRKEVCDVNTLITRSKDVFLTYIRENQKLEISPEEKLPKVDCDPSQIMRIISGLVYNAVEAMSKGGTVTIGADQIVINKESPHYEVPFGRYVRIIVRDNGIGMDAETKKRCFEPFFTTKTLDRSTNISTAGAGLGLAAAYALAQKNGGKLLVESRLGFGSQFTLYLPIAKQEALSQQILKETTARPEFSEEVEPSETRDKISSKNKEIEIKK